MIYKLIISTILVLSSSFIFPANYSAFENQQEIALVYTTESEDMLLTANILKRLTKVKKIHVDEIEPRTLDSFKGLVFVGTDDKQLSQQAVKELSGFRNPAIVIGSSALQLQPFKNWRLGKQVEIKQVSGHTLDHPIYWDEIIPPEDVNASKTLASFQKEYPFFIQLKNSNWSYMAMIPKQREVIYELPAIFHSIMQLQLPSNHEAFIVLSDVNANTDVATLKKMVDLLNKYNVPIHLEITSVSMDKSNGVVYYIADNRKVLDYLQTLQGDGATFILSEQVVPVEEGLHYFAMNDVYPTMVMNDSLLFSSRILQDSFYIYSEQTNANKQFNFTVPTLIGTGAYPLYEMEKEINQLFAVQGSLISFRYPNYLKEKHLVELINLVNTSNATWLDFQKMEHSIQIDKVQISQDSTGKLTFEQSFTYFERLKMMFERNLFELGLWILIIIVSLFVLVFFINTLRLRIILRKRLFEERKQHG